MNASLAIGLLGGIGLFLIWQSCWVVEPRGDAETGRPSWSVRTRDMLVQAGLARVRPAALVVASCGVALVICGLVYAVSRALVVAIALGVLCALVPYLIVSSMARRRQVQLRDVWPEAIDHLASGVRAGLSLPEALGELGTRGPDALRPEFTAFARDFHASGHFSSSLDRLKERLADPVGDRVVEALRLTREVGGSDLGALLRTLSGFLREDARTRSELEARQSWTVNAARLALAAPWIVLALMSTRPEAAQAYDSGLGAGVMAFGAVVSLLAYRIMLQIGRLPSDERVLR